MDYLTRARVRADTGWTSKRVREAIALILDAHGASGFADSSPMQRIWRDANTAGRHAIVNELVNEELYGKALLGFGIDEPGHGPRLVPHLDTKEE